MKIGVVGTGYVGLVVGACLAENGNTVVCVDIDEAKVAALRKGQVPIYEPGLEEMIIRNVPRSGCVSRPTCPRPSGQATSCSSPWARPGRGRVGGHRHVLRRGRGHRAGHGRAKVVVVKSTVPVGTNARLRQAIGALTTHPFSVVSNPEFLKEGRRLDDFLKPDRVVVGTDDPKVEALMRELYEPFVRTGNPRSWSWTPPPPS
jgi:UDPglucose 6-dehydrogenase